MRSSGIKKAFDDVQRLLAENARLRAVILGVARECAECHGTGRTGGYVMDPADPLRWRLSPGGESLPCDACRDLREALK